MDLRDLWAHEGAKAQKVLEEVQASLGPRDLTEHLGKQAHPEAKVKQEAKVLLVPQVQKELKGFSCVTGSSAFLRTYKITGIMV